MNHTQTTVTFDLELDSLADFVAIVVESGCSILIAPPQPCSTCPDATITGPYADVCKLVVDFDLDANWTIA